MLFVVTPKFWGDKTVSKYNSTKHRLSHVRKLEMANYDPGPVILTHLPWLRAISSNMPLVLASKVSWVCPQFHYK